MLTVLGSWIFIGSIITVRLNLVREILTFCSYNWSLEFFTYYCRYNGGCADVVHVLQWIAICKWFVQEVLCYLDSTISFSGLENKIFMTIDCTCRSRHLIIRPPKEIWYHQFHETLVWQKHQLHICSYSFWFNNNNIF